MHVTPSTDARRFCLFFQIYPKDMRGIDKQTHSDEFIAIITELCICKGTGLWTYISSVYAVLPRSGPWCGGQIVVTKRLNSTLASWKLPWHRMDTDEWECINSAMDEFLRCAQNLAATMTFSVLVPSWECLWHHLTVILTSLLSGADAHRYIRLPPPQSTKSRALGALLGMAVGDALGAPLGGQDGWHEQWPDDLDFWSRVIRDRIGILMVFGKIRCMSIWLIASTRTQWQSQCRKWTRWVTLSQHWPEVFRFFPR